jgi:hypothetical protein
MPGTAEILRGLGEIADSWQALAVLWHIYFGLFGAAALVGWRPSSQFVAALLIPPLASVSILAWMQGNPFNGTLFGILSVALIVLVRSMSVAQVVLASPFFLVLGTLLFAFGWAYPHFFEEDPGLANFYAAPLGVIPCPTLSVAVGITLIFCGLGSRVWSLVLSLVALFYGFLGSLYLDVTIDWVLTGGAVILLVLVIQRAVGSSNLSTA